MTNYDIVAFTFGCLIFENRDPSEEETVAGSGGVRPPLPFSGQLIDVREEKRMAESLDLSKMDEVLAHYRGENGSLIPVLQEAQSLYGYLPEEVLRRISRELNVRMAKIYGVITFYAQFYMTPRGKHVIKSCQGTACHVRGAKGVLDSLCRELKVEPGGTTGDLTFSLETVACVGTCFLAPVIMIDKDYYGKLTPKRAVDALKKYSPDGKKEKA
jgi:NADH:ubiquinone oxidoreductase subunit E